MRKRSRYLGLKSPNVLNADSEGVVLDSNRYGGEIRHIEISHWRAIAIEEILTENELTVSMSELGKLMWKAMIARPGAIYDASESAQIFPTEEMEVSRKRNGFFI